jgi:hypothetical protein
VTPRPSAKQIRNSFEQPTIWDASLARALAQIEAGLGTVYRSDEEFLRALQPERKAA